MQLILIKLVGWLSVCQDLYLFSEKFILENVYVHSFSTLNVFDHSHAILRTAHMKVLTALVYHFYLQDCFITLKRNATGNAKEAGKV